MKQSSITTIILLLGFLPLALFAQKSDTPSSAGIFKSHFTGQLNGGLTQYFGDLNKDFLFNQNVKSAYGGAFGYQFTPEIGIRSQFVMGKFYSVHVVKQIKLNTDFWDASFQFTLNLNELFSKYNESRFINLYLFGGAGLTSYTSKLSDFATGSLLSKSDQRQNEVFFPAGMGGAIRLAKHLSLNIEYGDHLVLSDGNLDLYSAGKKRDQYSYGSAGLEFTFGGPRDSDKDGIIDKKDICPNIAGKADLSGCPDADNDGIADNKDECPLAAGKAEFNGCPDKDDDGIPDKLDKCPDVRGKKELQGCPDKDNDGVTDAEDKCPDVAGKKAFAGCPDIDGDSVPDNLDKCPELAGLAKFNGCPDTDGDDVPDNIDKCPNAKGSVVNNGCPEESNVLVNEVVYFNTDEWIIIAQYNQLLNRVAETLRDNPGIRLAVDGHTDSRESLGYNMQLSENRADYVINFFTDRGIDPSRLVKHFYGETRPAASNNTAEGMALNRRVEMYSIK